MHIETKTQNTHTCLSRSLMAFAFISLTACSFVELKPGAENIIFAKQGEGCELIDTFTPKVKTSTLFIDRLPEAIRNELQILAQNKAYSLYANAIWPVSDVKEGQQTFELLKCGPNKL